MYYICHTRREIMVEGHACKLTANARLQTDGGYNRSQVLLMTLDQIIDYHKIRLSNRTLRNVGFL